MALVRAVVLLVLLAVPAAAADSPQAAAPLINPDGGAYPQNAPVTVSIRAEPGDSIIYTLDGSTPRPGNGIREDSHLVFFSLPPGEVRVRARALRPGLRPSPVTNAVFTREAR